MRHVTRCKPAMGGGTTDMEIDTIENVLEEEEKEGDGHDRVKVLVTCGRSFHLKKSRQSCSLS